MTLLGLALAQAVKDEAGRLGFDAVAIGPAAPPPHGEAFERWLDEGRAGSMDYLERTRAERLDPRRLLPGARAVVALALSYHASDEPAPTGIRIARYAGAGDYHDVIRPRLQALARFIETAAGPDARTRTAVDTSAVLERDLAALTGLGWIGKNTNLLTPKLGSWFFIATVLTTAELPFDDPVADRCGTCTACLDACPTAAFTGPYRLDARRCIAYLTIEHRGEIDEALRPMIGEWGFGCDVCQDVCPWNRRAATTNDPAFTPPAPLEPAALLALDEAAFRERFRSTAMWRARRSGLLRNAAIVLGNRGDASAAPALRGALADPDPVVRDAAEWALTRLIDLAGMRVAPLGGVVSSQGGGNLTMDKNKRDTGTQRNEEETGKPIQLDKDDQGHEREGQHQPGGQPMHKPETERKPDQGQPATKR